MLLRSWTKTTFLAMVVSAVLRPQEYYTELITGGAGTLGFSTSAVNKDIGGGLEVIACWKNHKSLVSLSTSPTTSHQLTCQLFLLETDLEFATTMCLVVTVSDTMVTSLILLVLFLIPLLLELLNCSTWLLNLSTKSSVKVRFLLRSMLWVTEFSVLSVLSN